jgi:hypothetical protein
MKGRGTELGAHREEGDMLACVLAGEGTAAFLAIAVMCLYGRRGGNTQSMDEDTVEAEKQRLEVRVLATAT